MANYLYNGVELPDINTVWTDNGAYPYAAIHATSTPQYVLWLTTTPPYYSVNNNVQLNGAGYYESYIFTPGGTGWTVHSTRRSYADSASFYWLSACVWTNTDIVYFPDGNIALAASEPMPAPTFDKVSFLAGLACGLCGRGRAPTAYLYNGVRLPALPEWDREAYPYAYITFHKNNGRYCLTLSLGTVVFYSKTGYLSNVKGCTRYVYYTLYDTEWKYFDSYETDTVYHKDTDELVWSSEDIADASVSGTIYLAASDPIPVYD